MLRGREREVERAGRENERATGRAREEERESREQQQKDRSGIDGETEGKIDRGRMEEAERGEDGARISRCLLAPYCALNPCRKCRVIETIRRPALVFIHNSIPSDESPNRADLNGVEGGDDAVDNWKTARRYQRVVQTLVATGNLQSSYSKHELCRKIRASTETKEHSLRHGGNSGNRERGRQSTMEKEYFGVPRSGREIMVDLDQQNAK
eukprot:6175735-Pleurochrysis_carterae.AAC.2